MNRLDTLKEKLDKLENIKQRLIEEEEKISVIHDRERMRKKKWRKEKEAEEAKILIREAEKAERKEKQNVLENRKKMVRWLAEFIDIKTDKWGEKEGQKMDLTR